jgi:hypothetical protein
MNYEYFMFLIWSPSPINVGAVRFGKAHGFFAALRGFRVGKRHHTGMLDL